MANVSVAFNCINDVNYRVTVEDDSRVAYAYLWMDTEIISSVWLYNRDRMGDLSEWKDKSNIPFLNCGEYANDGGIISKTVRSKDLNVDWAKSGETVLAYIYLFDDLIGLLASDTKPGYARHAIVDSPIAKVMHYE